MLKSTTLDNGNIIVEDEIPCGSCDSTGIYKGMAERDGAGVVCSHCHGKGFVEVKETFKPFDKRKTRKDITRVYETAGGYCISDKDFNKDGITFNFSKFGCSYEDWLNGSKPKPIEDLHCPYQHTNQGLQCKDKNDLYKNYCNKFLGWGGTISECKRRNQKHLCWEIYNG